MIHQKTNRFSGISIVKMIYFKKINLKNPYIIRIPSKFENYNRNQIQVGKI